MGLLTRLNKGLKSIANRGVQIVKSVAQRAPPILNGIYQASVPIQTAITGVAKAVNNPHFDKIAPKINKGLDLVGKSSLMTSQALQMLNRGHLYQNMH